MAIIEYRQCDVCHTVGPLFDEDEDRTMFGRVRLEVFNHQHIDLADVCADCAEEIAQQAGLAKLEDLIQ